MEVEGGSPHKPKPAPRRGKKAVYVSMFNFRPFAHSDLVVVFISTLCHIPFSTLHHALLS